MIGDQVKFLAINKNFFFQTERAFQKQPTVFLNKKRVLTGSKKKLRHVKNVGLGFKTPREVRSVKTTMGEFTS